MSSRFNFRGSCVAVGATPDPERPEKPTVFGTVSLPVIGGVAQEDVGGRRIKLRGKTLVKFKGAWTQSVGFQQGEHVRTRVKCRVEGLEVRDRVRFRTVLKAEELSAVARSNRRLGQPQDHKCPIEVPPFTFTLRARRKESDKKRVTFIIRVRTDGELWKIDHVNGIEEALKGQKLTHREGLFKYSPLSAHDIDCPTSPDIIITDNVVAVRDFGRIHLAELRRGSDSCRFSLMRIELGNPPEFQDVRGHQSAPPTSTVVIEPEVNGQEEDG